jgi:hypothetical protein
MAGDFNFVLPDLPSLSGLLGKKPLRAGINLLMGTQSPAEVMRTMAAHGAIHLLEKGWGSGAGQLQRDTAGPWRWEHWLRETPFATVAYVGGRGEGKTTCAFDTMDRLIKPTKRGLFAFGVGQGVLPPGYHQLPIADLRQMGVLLQQNPDWDGRLITRLFNLRQHPEGFCVLIDDASNYLNAKAHQKPEALALQTIVNEARHHRGIVLATFQNSRDVGRSIREVDAIVASRPNVLMMGPSGLGLDEDGAGHLSESDEYRAWMEMAAVELENVPPEEAVLTKFVACGAREVKWAGLWRHHRPDFYGEALSRNKAFVEGDDIDFELMAAGASGNSDVGANASGRFWCPQHQTDHYRSSGAGRRCWPLVEAMSR